MPFLRFTRDKRGYETTALVHASRHRGRAQQRLLYWFRTPPGVKVGRPALDEDAIHWIEEHNPDIEFDWPKILEAQPPPAPPPDDGRRRVRGEGKEGRGKREEGRGKTEEGRGRRRPEPSTRPAPQTPQPPVEAATPVESGPVSLEEQDALFEDAPPLDERAVREDAPMPEPEEDEALPEDAPLMPLMPLMMDALEQITHPDAEEPLPPTRRAIESVVGKEQLTRLRARYAELQARITERGGDTARIEELRAQAEALNPDTWVTDEEARKGLQGFDAKVRDLRAALGLRPRRRSRRGGRRRRRGGQGSPSGSPAADQGGGPAEGPPSKPEDFSE